VFYYFLVVVFVIVWVLCLLFCGGCVCYCVGVLFVIVCGLFFIVWVLCLLLCDGSFVIVGFVIFIFLGLCLL